MVGKLASSHEDFAATLPFTCPRDAPSPIDMRRHGVFLENRELVSWPAKGRLRAERNRQPNS